MVMSIVQNRGHEAASSWWQRKNSFLYQNLNRNILIKNNSIKDRFKTVMRFFPSVTIQLMKEKELTWEKIKTRALDCVLYSELTFLFCTLSELASHLWMEQFILRVIHSKLMQLVSKWNAINNNFLFYNTSCFCCQCVKWKILRWIASDEGETEREVFQDRMEMKEVDKWICIYC